MGSTQAPPGEPLHVLDAMCVAAYLRLQQAPDPLSVSNLMWGLAKLDHHPGPVMTQRMEGCLLARLHEATPQTVSTMLWVRAPASARPPSQNARAGDPPPEGGEAGPCGVGTGWKAALGG